MKFPQVFLTFLAASLSIGLSSTEAGIESMYDPSLKPFYHGVASGDPLPDGMIIWTRITPNGYPNRVRVSWEVATDPKMANVVRSGRTRAYRSSDYTVKVDVRGLRPDRD